MARLRVVPVSSQFWQQMMTEGNIIQAKCLNGLPEGAELVSSYYEGNPPTMGLIFHHESFSDIPTGDIIPWIIPTFESFPLREESGENTVAPVINEK